jgi:cytochrome P450
MLARMIEQRRNLDADPPGLLDHLLALRDQDGRPLLTDEQIRDEAITLMLAGHETTAQALTWTWHLLARNPRVEAELHSELDAVLGDRPVVAGDYPSLPYTEAVFREALRLYPPVWALARIATEPYRLGGRDVPAGGTIVASQWVVQRSGEHFHDPLAFAPTRWLDEPPPPAGSYFPFAAGPRICIGERFSMLEGTLVLATLARRWRVIQHDAVPRLDARFTLRPRNGLPAVTVARR